MAAILVHSFDGDVHAEAVIWALAELGRTCVFWPSGKFPAEQPLSLSFGSSRDCPSALVIEADRRRLPGTRAVWNRRPHEPKLSSALPESEHEFVEIESRIFLRSMMRLLSPDAFWVNPPHVAEADSYKPLQLSLALKAGFRVPETLFSNDPDFLWQPREPEVTFKHYGDTITDPASAKQVTA